MGQFMLVARSFVVHKGKTLIVKRSLNDSHHPGLWECPGGKLDEGENIESALLREFLQETGLIVELMPYLAYVDDRKTIEVKYGGILAVVIFKITKIIGGQIKLSEEHDDSAWVTYKGIQTFDLTPEVRRASFALRKYLK